MPERLDWNQFWPFYLAEHNDRRNRIIHTAGTTVALAFIAAAIVMQNGWLLLGAFVSGYAFAWIGHAVFQRNRPATFRYPIKSFVSDWRLWALTISGRGNTEYERFGIEQR